MEESVMYTTSFKGAKLGMKLWLASLESCDFDADAVPVLKQLFYNAADKALSLALEATSAPLPVRGGKIAAGIITRSGEVVAAAPQKDAAEPKKEKAPKKAVAPKKAKAAAGDPASVAVPDSDNNTK
jgi:hypothetical protein